MGEASSALFEGGSVSWKKAKDSVRIDTKRLQAEQPALVSAYEVTRPGSRRFTVNVDE